MRVLAKILLAGLCGVSAGMVTAFVAVVASVGHPLWQLVGFLVPAVFLFFITLQVRKPRRILGWACIVVGLDGIAWPAAIEFGTAWYAQRAADPDSLQPLPPMPPAAVFGTGTPVLIAGVIVFAVGVLLVRRSPRERQEAQWEEEAQHVGH